MIIRTMLYTPQEMKQVGSPTPFSLPSLALQVPDTEQDGAREWAWPPTAPCGAACRGRVSVLPSLGPPE